MPTQVFPGNVGNATLVRTGNGVPRTLVLMTLNSVKNKLLAAVWTWLSALRALRQGMLGQNTPHHTSATLVLAINALLRTAALVFLEGLACEIAATEFTSNFALRTVVLHVLWQVSADEFGATAIGTRDHIKGTNTEMSLELLQLPTPATTLFTMYTSYRQTKDLSFQLPIWVDLCVV